MLLIVYGSFRSLNMEREARERAEREREATLLGGKPATTSSANSSELFCILKNSIYLKEYISYEKNTYRFSHKYFLYYWTLFTIFSGKFSINKYNKFTKVI